MRRAQASAEAGNLARSWAESCIAATTASILTWPSLPPGPSPLRVRTPVILDEEPTLLA